MPIDSDNATMNAIIGGARGHLLGWCAYTDATFRAPKHVVYIANALMELEVTDNARLIITVPPRHGKSELATKKFPSWYLGRNPEHRMILASHTADLAWNFSRAVRNEFVEYGSEVFGHTVSSDSKAKQAWDLKGHKGGVVASGVGGPLTGRGADCYHPDTKIMTEEGPLSIEYIYNMDKMPRILSYDHEKKNFEYKRVEARKKSITIEMYRVVTYSGRELLLTGDHKLYTENKFRIVPKGYTEVKNTRPGHLLHYLGKSRDQSFPSSLKTEVITKVGRADCEHTTVYDLQIEDNNNFFANSILSHNCLIIDDPVKDEMSASSPTSRERIWNWYRQVARTRVHPKGKIIIIMTRWNEADLVGKILAESSEQWRTINLPALAEDNDELGRDLGAALWPERYDQESLHSIRRDIGSYAFASLYQQRPSPPEGALVKKSHIKYYMELPDDFDKVIQVWDCAVEAKDTSSYVVGQVWGKKGPDRYLLDQFRSRVDILGTMIAIKNLRKKWPKAQTTYIEKKANGAPVIQILKRQMDSISAFDPKGSKEQRLNACLPLFEGNNIIVPDPSIAPWVNDLVYELITFPHGVNDDQVDCLSMAQDRFNVGYNMADMTLRLNVGETGPHFIGTNNVRD